MTHYNLSCTKTTPHTVLHMYLMQICNLQPRNEDPLIINQHAQGHFLQLSCSDELCVQDVIMLVSA